MSDLYLRTGGELNLRIVQANWIYQSTHYSPSNSNEVMEMLLTIDHLKPEQIRIGYFPYGRADRAIFHPGLQEEEPNGCVTMCRLLRSVAPVARISVLDAHNPRVLEAFNIKNVYPNFMVPRTRTPSDNIVIVSPDGGAADRAKYYSYDDKTYPILFCQKTRDVNGKPSVFVPQDVDLENKTCVIVDDIIDGGRTFVNLAATLKKEGAGEVILHVTHGIFSNGYDLGPDIDHIFVTNTCPGARTAREQKIPHITVTPWSI